MRHSGVRSIGRRALCISGTGSDKRQIFFIPPGELHLGLLLIAEKWYGILHYQPYHLQKWYGYCRVCQIGSAASVWISFWLLWSCCYATFSTAWHACVCACVHECLRGVWSCMCSCVSQCVTVCDFRVLSLLSASRQPVWGHVNRAALIAVW